MSQELVELCSKCGKEDPDQDFICFDDLGYPMIRTKCCYERITSEWREAKGGNP